jgi:hypothetical protein
MLAFLPLLYLIGVRLELIARMMNQMVFEGVPNEPGRVKEVLVKPPLEKAGVEKIEHKRNQFLAPEIHGHVGRFPILVEPPSRAADTLRLSAAAARRLKSNFIAFRSNVSTGTTGIVYLLRDAY